MAKKRKKTRRAKSKLEYKRLAEYYKKKYLKEKKEKEKLAKQEYKRVANIIDNFVKKFEEELKQIKKGKKKLDKEELLRRVKLNAEIIKRIVKAILLKKKGKKGKKTGKKAGKHRKTDKRCKEVIRDFIFESEDEIRIYFYGRHSSDAFVDREELVKQLEKVKKEKRISKDRVDVFIDAITILFDELYMAFYDLMEMCKRLERESNCPCVSDPSNLYNFLYEIKPYLIDFLNCKFEPEEFIDIVKDHLIKTRENFINNCHKDFEKVQFEFEKVDEFIEKQKKEKKSKKKKKSTKKERRRKKKEEKERKKKIKSWKRNISKGILQNKYKVIPLENYGKDRFARELVNGEVIKFATERTALSKKFYYYNPKRKVVIQATKKINNEINLNPRRLRPLMKKYNRLFKKLGLKDYNELELFEFNLDKIKELEGEGYLLCVDLKSAYYNTFKQILRTKAMKDKELYKDVNKFLEDLDKFVEELQYEGLRESLAKQIAYGYLTKPRRIFVNEQLRVVFSYNRETSLFNMIATETFRKIKRFLEVNGLLDKIYGIYFDCFYIDEKDLNLSHRELLKHGFRVKNVIMYKVYYKDGYKIVEFKVNPYALRPFREFKFQLNNA
ncbi:MAG: hypothetical protein ABIL45_04220 [candidate division WOR-3 bacterium]